MIENVMAGKNLLKGHKTVFCYKYTKIPVKVVVGLIKLRDKDC